MNSPDLQADLLDLGREGEIDHGAQPGRDVRRRVHDRSAWDTRRARPRARTRSPPSAQMFDAIAPRYDLVNRIMTFRLDVRWRRKAVVLARPGPRRDGGRPRLRHRRPVRRPGRRPGTVRCRSTCQLRHARRRPQRRAARAGRHPPPPAPRRRGRRRDVRLRPAQPRRPRRRSSPSSAGSCARAAASPCSTSASRSNRLVRCGNGIYFGQVVPRIGGLLSDGAAYRYLPKSVAYLPAPDDDARPSCTTPGSATPSTSAVGRHHPAARSAPAADVRAVTVALERTVDLDDVCRGDGLLFVRDGVGVAGRGVAPPARRRRRRRPRRASTATTIGLRHRCRSAVGGAATACRRRRRADRAGDRGRQGADG